MIRSYEAALPCSSPIALTPPDNSFRDKFERSVARDRTRADLRRKALAAIAAKLARTAHAIIKRGVVYRPFFEGAVPCGRTPLCAGRRDAAAISKIMLGSSAWVWDLVLRTVSAVALTLCLLWERPLP